MGKCIAVFLVGDVHDIVFTLMIGSVKKLFRILSVAACAILAACGSSGALVTELPFQSLPLSNGQTVFVEIDGGAVELGSGAQGVVEISGSVPSSDRGSFSAMQDVDGIHITVRKVTGAWWQGDAPMSRLELRVPSGGSVHVDTSDATITVHDFKGQVSVTSVSGDTDVENSSGQFMLAANRGNVTVEASSGEMHVAGNYGMLSLNDTSGVMAASTIMGTIRFAGSIGAGDSLSLETDHGPIEMRLAAESNATVEVGTTTGVITCIMPGLHYAGQGCTGTLQGGLGQVTVRTVSGNVLLEPLP